MRKAILSIALLSILLSGCKDSLEESKTNNEDYEVDFLFEHDGIKVYRFYDRLEYHYFTSQGETISTKTTHVNTGKGVGVVRHYENIR